MMNRATTRSRAKRHAALLVELLVAIVVLGVAMTFIATLLGLASGVRRNSARHAAAREEAVNVMERLMASPYEKLLDESLRRQPSSVVLTAAVPDASVTINVQEVAEPLPARRITVAITWPGVERRAADRPGIDPPSPGRSSAAEHPAESRQTLAELTTWRYERKGARR